MFRQLLMLAVVIGVVLSQNQGGRRGSRGRAIHSSPLPRRPVFQGATLSQAQGPVRIVRPRFPQGNPRIGVRKLPAPPPPTPAPTTTTTDFPDYDYVYVDDLGQDYILPNPVAAPLPAFAPAPRPQVFTPQPAPRRPQVFTPQPALRRPAPAPRPAPRPAQRRPADTLASLDRDFNLKTDGNQKIRGRKEPAVKILKSWSHQNVDGTFSWGYVNTDGSFKNETRGLDCVVRGIYGYVDQDTGREVSFPYESGNPCDPDAPDYFYDYDANVMMIKEANGQFVSRPGAVSRPRQG